MMTKRQLTRLIGLRNETAAAGDLSAAEICQSAIDGSREALRKVSELYPMVESEKLIGHGDRQRIPVQRAIECKSCDLGYPKRTCSVSGEIGHRGPDCWHRCFADQRTSKETP